MQVDLTKRVTYFNGKKKNYGIVDLILLNDNLNKQQKICFIEQIEIGELVEKNTECDEIYDSIISNENICSKKKQN